MIDMNKDKLLDVASDLCSGDYIEFIYDGRNDSGYVDYIKGWLMVKGIFIYNTKNKFIDDKITSIKKLGGVHILNPPNPRRARCKNCKHYKSNIDSLDTSNTYNCLSKDVIDNVEVDFGMGTEYANIVFGPEFGCVNFEAKED